MDSLIHYIHTTHSLGGSKNGDSVPRRRREEEGSRKEGAKCDDFICEASEAMRLGRQALLLYLVHTLVTHGFLLSEMRTGLSIEFRIHDLPTLKRAGLE